MKKLLALLLILALLTPVFAACGGGEEATSTTENKPPYIPESTEGLKFKLNKDKKSYTLVGIGTCEKGDIVIGTYNGLPVTAIANNAFQDNWSAKYLEKVTILEGVEVIGMWGFASCRVLKEITLPKTLIEIKKRAFMACVSLKKVTIPEGTKTLGEGVFKDCEGLREVTIPNSVTKISSGVFNWCRNLETLTIPFVGETRKGRNNKRIGYIFGGENATNAEATVKNVIVAGETGIPDMAFFGCNHIQSITLKGSITRIGDSAFANCVNLKSVKLPNTLKEIGPAAFLNCINLEDINLPMNIETLAPDAFEGCVLLNKEGSGGYDDGSIISGDYVIKNLEDVGYIIKGYRGNENYIVIPKELEGHKIVGIGERAFTDVECNSITIPNTVTYIASYAFSTFSHNGFLLADPCKAKIVKFEEGSKLTEIKEGTFRACTALEKIELPESLDSIGDAVFANCDSLKEVTLPKSLETMGKMVFYECAALQEITLPEGMDRVGSSLFSGCEKLEKVVLPESVKYIDNNAFYECSMLEEINFPKGLSTIGEDAFYACSSLRTIDISASVTEIKGSFWGCSSLETINVAKENADYSSLGNCLVHKKTKTLIIAAKNAVIPADGSVEIISAGAFEGFKDAKDIYIPASVHTIASSAFSACAKIESIECDTKNEHYFASGNCLIEKETKTLVLGCKNSVIPADGSVGIIGESSFEYRQMSGILTIPEGVHTIGRYAFRGCRGIDSIKLPDSLTQILDGVFMDSDLVSITIPGSMKKVCFMFNRCNKLTTVVLEEGVEEIAYAFRQCPELTNVVLPSTLKTMGCSSFSWCGSIKKIVLPASLETISNNAIESCVLLESIEFEEGFDANVFSIGAFVNCPKIKYNEYDNGRYLGSVKNPYAFFVAAKNREIKNCTVHKDTLIIASNAFKDCVELVSVTLPSGLIKICSNAFEKTNITEIELPDALTYIGSGAFKSCESLKSLVLPSGIVEIGRGAFDHCYRLDYNTYKNGRYIPSKDDTYFILCDVLDVSEKTVELHKDTKIIYSYSFRNCMYIEEVALPEGLICIKEYAFGDNRMLKRIIIPSTVEKIDGWAFYNCEALEIIEYNGTKAQWNAIDKRDASITNKEGKITVKCTDGDITIEKWYKKA